ncbi:MAG TPA: PepSY-associated TM helix domain-containing protein [Polyangiales bacterium]|nr:PepSY-associated TM helix domain-containing protein [Polyangiales bacterium]
MADGEQIPIADREQPTAVPARRKARWLGHAWVRAFHRDAGFLVVGLTVIYALSGLAVNHIADWDPNFVSFERKHELGKGLSGDKDALARTVLARLKIDERPSDVFRDGDLLEVALAERTLHVTVSSGQVLEQGQKSRFLLRTANYLHLNRGKPAWKYIADGYAVLLLLLVLSGLAMLPGKRGVLGRGAVFVAIGIAVPVLYVTLS